MLDSYSLTDGDTGRRCVVHVHAPFFATYTTTQDGRRVNVGFVLTKPSQMEQAIKEITEREVPKPKQRPYATFSDEAYSMLRLACLQVPREVVAIELGDTDAFFDWLVSSVEPPNKLAAPGQIERALIGIPVRVDPDLPQDGIRFVHRDEEGGR